MIVVGIDPGPKDSAYAIVRDDGYSIDQSEKIPNDDLIQKIRHPLFPFDAVAIESIQSYGMIVGREVFETCYMIGRVIQVCVDLGVDCALYPRPEYARQICGVGKVNDAVLRQSLMLRFGGDRKGEPLNALKGCTDKRSAFAVAVYHIDLSTQSLFRRKTGMGTR